MKKYFYGTLVLAVFSVLGFYACTETEVIKSGSSDNYSQTSDLIIGSFNSSGTIFLDLTQVEMEQVFLDYCDDEGFLNASFESAIIEDQDANSSNIQANLEIKGSYETVIGDFVSITMGMELDKDYGNNDYIVNGGSTGKWSCAGQNCASCDPSKNGLGKVVGCNCLRAADPENSTVTPACVHSSSGGGNGLGWVGAILSAMGILLAN